MVEWTQIVGGWALAVLVKLGIPLVVLFGVGYSLYLRRARRPRERPASTGLQGGSARVATRRGPRGPARCWEMRRCPTDVRDRCPAFWRPEVPCWQALKEASGGCIDSKCLGCSLLLSR